jgi:hypothetical protein
VVHAGMEGVGCGVSTPKVSMLPNVNIHSGQNFPRAYFFPLVIPSLNRLQSSKKIVCNGSKTSQHRPLGSRQSGLSGVGQEMKLFDIQCETKWSVLG